MRLIPITMEVLVWVNNRSSAMILVSFKIV